MAYLAFQELTGGAAGIAAAAPRPTDRLTPLEWQVVRLARGDRLASLRPAGWLRRALRLLVPLQSPTLADARLEALRRLAVLTWHEGYAVPAREVRAFLAAGFTPAQYETLAGHIGAVHAAPRAPAFA